MRLGVVVPAAAAAAASVALALGAGEFARRELSSDDLGFRVAAILGAGASGAAGPR